MNWIFLSPHLDDAAYSCGSLISWLSRKGHDVEIWTIFAGDPPALDFSPFANAIHARWGTGDASSAARRMEDTAACRRLGVTARHLDFLDVIYRTNPVSGEPEIHQDEDLFRAIQPEDQILQAALTRVLEVLAAEQATAVQFCVPLGLGNHIDHTLVRKAAEDLQLSSPLAYYADFPYVLKTEAAAEFSTICTYPVEQEDVAAWGDAAAFYPSQLGTFWNDEAQMRQELTGYWKTGGGCRLWFQDQ